MNTVVTILCFILMLSAIILIHEFGHFIFAKIFKVYVYEFSLGMGPQLLKWKGKETIYSLRLLPIGGYCAMAGEDEKENLQDVANKIEVPKERTITNIHWFKKILIMFAGPAMNFLLAWLIFIGIYANVGYKVINPPAYVNGVVEGSPAQAAGFEYGDQIEKVTYSDGTYIVPEDFYDIINENLYHHDEMTYTISRNGETIDITVTPVYNETDQKYEVGIILPESETVKLDGLGVIKAATDYFGDASTLIFKVFKKLFRGIGLENLSGPIGIYSATATELQYGFTSFMALVGVLSLNIGIANLIPIPMFDGGRILITIIEAIIRRPLPPKVVNALMSASLILILLLFAFVTYNDIARLL